MKPRGVIFDAYGTLIDTGDNSVRATRAILQKRGIDLDPRKVYARWKELHREHIDSLKEFVCEESIFEMDLRRLYEEYGIKGDAGEDVQIMLATLGVRTAFPETIHVLDQLRREYALYIGSNSDEEPLLSDLRRNEIRVDQCFTSESLQVYKPREEFYRKILESTALHVDEVVFVGDSPLEDGVGPKSVGITTIWLNRKQRLWNYVESRPDYEIPNLLKLLPILAYTDKPSPERIF